MQCNVMKCENGIEFCVGGLQESFFLSYLITYHDSIQTGTDWMKNLPSLALWMSGPRPLLPRAKMSCNLLLKTSTTDALVCLKKEFMDPPIVVLAIF